VRVRAGPSYLQRLKDRTLGFLISAMIGLFQNCVYGLSTVKKTSFYKDGGKTVSTEYGLYSVSCQLTRSGKGDSDYRRSNAVITALSAVHCGKKLMIALHSWGW